MRVTDIPPNPRRSWICRWQPVFIAVCLFGFVLGSNWATFERFGSDLPDWDQWDAEASQLLIPWFEHDHFLSHLVTPQNEHRVLLTKVQNLAVVLVAGTWDARVEGFVNAFLHAFIAVGLWEMGRRWLRAGLHVPFFVLTALLYGLPLSWQNLVGGFHSPQYWLILISMLAIASLPFATPWTRAWWGGLLASILALGTMGSGFLAAAVVLVLVVWRWVQRATSLRSSWPTLVTMAALIAFGAATRIEVSYHQVLKAKTAHDFGMTILRSLAWPVRGYDGAAAILWLPWLLFAMVMVYRLFTRRTAHGASTRPEMILLGLGGWVIAQLLATAYARGAGGGYPASRYMDTLIFATGTGGLALGWLVGPGFGPHAAPTRASWLLRGGAGVLAIAWAVTVVVGAVDCSERNVRSEVAEVKASYLLKEAHVRTYLMTHDRADLIDPIPYPSPDVLIRVLSHPAISERLPGSVRPPLKLVPANPNATFVFKDPTAHPSPTGVASGVSPSTPELPGWSIWGSYTREGAAATGTWRSAPLTSLQHGWLRFETAGSVGEAGVSLELRDAATDAVLAQVRPSKVPHDTWRTAYVRAPRQPFVVVATDKDPSRWLAFSAPVEMTSVSYGCWLLMKNGILIAEIFGTLGLIATLVRCRAEDVEARPSSVPASIHAG